MWKADQTDEGDGGRDGAEEWLSLQREKPYHQEQSGIRLQTPDEGNHVGHSTKQVPFVYLKYICENNINNANFHCVDTDFCLHTLKVQYVIIRH